MAFIGSNDKLYFSTTSDQTAPYSDGQNLIYTTSIGDTTVGDTVNIGYDGTSTGDYWSIVADNILGLSPYELSDFFKENKITLDNFKEYFVAGKDGRITINPEKIRAKRALDDLKK